MQATACVATIERLAVLLAAYRGNVYDVVLLVHLVAFLVAFAPAAINPLLERYFAQNGGEPVVRTWAGFAAQYTRKAALGGLVVLLLTGVAMVIMSDEVIEFSEAWVSLAFLVWFAIAGVVSAVILKGEKAMAAGDHSGSALVAKGGPIATVLLLVMLYLMVFKPGSPL